MKLADNMEINDSYYNTVILSGLTNTGSIDSISIALKGHTVQCDDLGNIISVDNRKIAYIPCIYCFADGMDLDGNKTVYTDDHLKMIKENKRNSVKILTGKRGFIKSKHKVPTDEIKYDGLGLGT